VDDGVRIDKWLWAARFFKTRGLAQQEIEKGRVLLADERVKPARSVRPGDVLKIRSGEVERTILVQALSDRRGPAPVAQALYEETPESVRARVEAQARRALYVEPSDSIAQGRPTKRDRRQLARLGPRG
jgi:ribosome-associated heat shock protein Hsp15